MVTKKFTTFHDLKEIAKKFAKECQIEVPIFFYGGTEEERGHFLSHLFKELTGDFYLLYVNNTFFSEYAGEQGKVHYYNNLASRDKNTELKVIVNDFNKSNDTYFVITGGYELSVEDLIPERRAEIHILETKHTNKAIEFKFFKTGLNKDIINEIKDDFVLPSLLQDEEKIIIEEGEKISKLMLEAGEIIDIEFTNSLFKISHLFAPLDLTEEQFDRYFTDNPELKEFWQKEREKFKDLGSENMLYNFFMKNLHSHIAKTIRLKGLKDLKIKENKSWPGKIIFYITKRVWEGKYVPVTTALDQFYENNPEIKNKEDAVSIIKEIEDELVEDIGLQHLKASAHKIKIAKTIIATSLKVLVVAIIATIIYFMIK